MKTLAFAAVVGAWILALPACTTIDGDDDDEVVETTTTTQRTSYSPVGTGTVTTRETTMAVEPD
jgi:hypothetical protein